MATLKEQFGARLRDFRLQKRMVQKDFAAFLGVSADHVSALERGISGPSFDTLERIADRLGVSVGGVANVPATNTSATPRAPGALGRVRVVGGRIRLADIQPQGNCRGPCDFGNRW